MEETFITIHNLSAEANVLFASESIVDILGYQPHEVQGKSCFDYFHPDEERSARTIHSRGILLDKAAVLNYLRVRTRDGRWLSCECCFTVVHDVLVACTSIYRSGVKSSRRALEAPQIRRIFSCSPRDPRYHMLEHLSPKFRMPAMEREPRAALILNRFTRQLTIMYATDSVASILGVRPDQIQDKSFYECIAENCTPDAISCLESAKANDSIAYLRFWYRDPRREEDFEAEDAQQAAEEENNGRDGDVRMQSRTSSDSDEGGVRLNNDMEIDFDSSDQGNIKNEPSSPRIPTASIPEAASSSSASNARSGDSSRAESSMAASAGQASTGQFSAAPQGRASPAAGAQRRNREPIPSFELEAVVSCTSDGLVVVLRKARPPIPDLQPTQTPVSFANGLFAAPWSEQPIQPYYPPDLYYHFRPPLMPQYMPVQDHIKAAGGPPIDQLMRSIRDVAVFAWALVGINGKFASYSRGKPRDEAAPPEGLPIWDPGAGETDFLPPDNQAVSRNLERSHLTAMHPPPPPYAPSPLVSHVPGYGGRPIPPGYAASYATSSSSFTTMHFPYYPSSAWPHFSPYPIGYANPGPMPLQPGLMQHPLPPYHPQHTSAFMFGSSAQGQWSEASSSYTQQNTSYHIPTTQPPHPGGPSDGYQRGQQ